MNRLHINFCPWSYCSHILHISLHQNSAEKECLYLIYWYIVYGIYWYIWYIHSLIVSLASEEFKNEWRWMNVQALKHRQHEWRRPTVKHLTYAPLVSTAQACSLPCVSASTSGILSLFLGLFLGFVIFALSSGVYLNFLNYWKAVSWLHI